MKIGFIGCGNMNVIGGTRQKTVYLAQILTITNSFGRTEIVPERMMDAVGAVSGCSPAYVFMFIEAMADAAVAQGMPRKISLQPS